MAESITTYVLPGQSKNRTAAKTQSQNELMPLPLVYLIVDHIPTSANTMGENVLQTANGDNLLIALKQQNVSQAERLLRKGDIDVSVADSAGMGCLHYASSDGFMELAGRLILENGTDVNTTDRENQTPLHKAAARGHVDMMVKLAALGANVEAMDNMKNTPLTLAMKNNHMDAIQTLLILGSPAIKTDTTSSTTKEKDSTNRPKENGLEAILMDHQKIYGALKHGEIIHSLQHSYKAELPTKNDSSEPSEGPTDHEMMFPDLQISLTHKVLKHPFVVYARRTRPDVVPRHLQVSGDGRIFGDIISYKSWFLPKAVVKMFVTVDGILRMNERLHIKSMGDLPFDGRIEGSPDIDKTSQVTKVTVVLTMKDSPASALMSFALVVTEEQEQFNITDSSAVLKSKVEPEMEIHIPEKAFKSPGVMNIEFTDSCDANEEDEEPLLATNILDITMEDNQQPIASIDIKLPFTTAINSDDIVILGSSGMTSEDGTLQWTPINPISDGSSTSTTFKVSHFSTYVGVSRYKADKCLDDVKLAATHSLRKQRKVVFFVMTRVSSTRTEPSFIVVECCTKRKVQSRQKHWTAKGYQLDMSKEILQQTMCENEKVRVSLDGILDLNVKPLELTFLPNSASYKVFDIVFPTVQQQDDISQDGNVINNETIVGNVIIENINPKQEPEVIPNGGCLHKLVANIKSRFSSQRVQPTPVERRYSQRGTIALSLSLQDTSSASES